MVIFYNAAVSWEDSGGGLHRHAQTQMDIATNRIKDGRGSKNATF